MRDIKFRAWDKQLSVMRYTDIYPKSARDWEDYEQSFGCMLNVIQMDYSLMQYTGLKDKNGKEIYEGDIVRYRITASYDENEKKEVIKVVRYTGGGFFPVFFMEYEFHDYDDKPLTITDVEIIGNVWENPELNPTQERSEP
jgi:uncharacterized phage protein (TIGR01671 family)